MLIIMENVANIELTCLICLNIVRMARSWLISVSSEATHNAAKTTIKYTTPRLPRERDEVRRTKKKFFTSNPNRVIFYIRSPIRCQNDRTASEHDRKSLDNLAVSAARVRTTGAALYTKDYRASSPESLATGSRYRHQNKHAKPGTSA